VILASATVIDDHGMSVRFPQVVAADVREVCFPAVL
jgi:hypothetical protein